MGPISQANAGERALKVVERTQECHGVVSFRLAAEDETPLPSFEPGQYLTCSLDLPGQDRPVIRCYSLSDAPADTYRVTIKRVGNGLVSTHINVALEVGDVLRARPPQGRFVLDASDPGARVFLAGGIGVTPLLSMVNALAERGGDGRRVHFYYGVRSSREHAFKAHLEALTAQHDWLDLHVAYSRATGGDRQGVDYRHRGRITPALLARTLAPSNEPPTFYACGPAAMLDDNVRGLEALDVPKGRIHVETFGAAAVRPLTRRLKTKRLAGPPPQVTFARSGKTVAWDPNAMSLLDLAMANDVFFPFACAAGHCGTCASDLLCGKVAYGAEPQFPLRDGRCLPCIAIPDGDVSLDV